MAKKGTTNMWKTVLQIALAVLFIVGGLNVFFNSSKDELIRAVGNVFSNGTVRSVVCYIMAAIELIAGLLLILDFFHIKSLDKLDDIFLAIIMIAWLIVFVILGEFVPLFKGTMNFLTFLVALAKDAVMIAAMGIVKARI